MCVQIVERVLPSIVGLPVLMEHPYYFARMGYQVSGRFQANQAITDAPGGLY